MSDEVGKLTALSAIALRSDDGWTYLNDEARNLITDAAAEIARLTRENEALRAELEHLRDLILVGDFAALRQIRRAADEQRMVFCPKCGESHPPDMDIGNGNVVGYPCQGRHS